MGHPRTAYISLWFPKPSETFIFREVKTLLGLGLDVRNYNLYSPLKRHLSQEMRDFPLPTYLGSRKTPAVLGALFNHLVSSHKRTRTLIGDGVFNGCRSLEGLGENLWALCCGLHLAPILERDGIEHIHAPWANGPAMAAWAASVLTGIPFSFAARAGDIYPPEGALSRKIKAASFVRVNHNANLPYLRSFAPDQEEKIHLVYNALTLAPKTVRTRQPGTTLALVAAGRFIKTKGFDDLLAACRRLMDKGGDFTLDLAGDGHLRGSLTKQATRLGLGDRVRFPGFLNHDRLSELMNRCDCLVMPSVVAPGGGRDGIPNVIMEGYAHGLSVIATDVAGICEVVENDETGHLVPPNSPEELARAITDLTENPEANARMAEQGRQRVKRMFDPERNCRALMALFAAHAR